MSKCDIDPSIWIVCPEVTALQLPPSFKWTKPPPNHPITYLRLVLSLRINIEGEILCSYCGRAHPGMLEFLGMSVQDIIDAGISRPAFHDTWTWAFRGYYVQTNIFCLVAELRGHDILLVDRDHLTMEDYLVSELEIVRRGVRPYTNPLGYF